MGQELAPWTEWNHEKSLDWHLTEHMPHKGMQSLIRDLNHVYRQYPALHARDCESEGFEWLIGDDAENSVFAWARHSGDGKRPCVVVSNFTSVMRENYTLPLPKSGNWVEVFNSDAENYWGTGKGNKGHIEGQNKPSHGKTASAQITLPPLATMIFVSET